MNSRGVVRGFRQALDLELQPESFVRNLLLLEAESAVLLRADGGLHSSCEPSAPHYSSTSSGFRRNPRIFGHFSIFGFPDRRRLEGVRNFVFWDRTVKGWRGSGNFGEWGDFFVKYRDFPHIFPDLFGNFPNIGEKNQVLF